MIRIKTESGAYPLTGWRRVVAVRTTTNTSDTVTLASGMAAEVNLDDSSKGNLVWESALPAMPTVYAWMFREIPATDEDLPESLHG